MITTKKNNGDYETCQYSITLFLFYKTIVIITLLENKASRMLIQDYQATYCSFVLFVFNKEAKCITYNILEKLRHLYGLTE